MYDNSMKEKYKLLLINPHGRVNSGLSASEQSLFPPLGLGIIASLTPSDYDVSIIDENFDDFEYTEADLVGITAFTSAAVRAYEIAGIYRHAGIPVVLGGIHVSMMPDEALQYADSVVIGEAESVWADVLSDFEHGTLQQRYTGSRRDMSDSAVPRRDLFHPGYSCGSVQTSRGCPMNCSFCSVTAFNGSKYRLRPVNEVLDELETVPQKNFFFVDDNIIGHSSRTEARALELFRGMVSRGINKTWFCQASVNFGLNPEVLEWAHRAGCRMVFIGLEAVDENELEAMEKRLNVKTDYETVFRNIHRAGIAVLGAFIFGTDSDTAGSLRRKTEYIRKKPIDVIQTTTLTPLPGTRLFEELDNAGRLLFADFPRDWLHYDMTELTFMPEKMGINEFNRVNISCQGRLLSGLMLFRKFIRTAVNTRSLETALWALNSNLVYRKAFKAAGIYLKKPSAIAQNREMS